MASWEHSHSARTLDRARSWWSICRSTFVCLGTLVSCDELFLELKDADLHDFRDSPATREVYVYDSVRLGIRRNRAVLFASMMCRRHSICRHRGVLMIPCRAKAESSTVPNSY